MRIGAVTEQQPHERGVRVGGGHQQRRHHTGSRVRIGAALEEQSHGGDLPAVNRMQQRRPVVTPVARVEVGAGVEERRHGIDRAASRGPHQGCQAVTIAFVGVVSIVEQLADGGDGVARRAEGQRHDGALGAGVGREQGVPHSHEQHQSVHRNLRLKS
jgi:hypothetical protein